MEIATKYLPAQDVCQLLRIIDNDKHILNIRWQAVYILYSCRFLNDTRFVSFRETTYVNIQVKHNFVFTCYTESKKYKDPLNLDLEEGFERWESIVGNALKFINF